MTLGAILILVVSVLLALALAAPASPLAAVDRLFESLTFRFFAPARPPSDRIVIIGITDDTLGRLPYRSPLDRGLLARLVETLANQEVRAIGLDVIIDQPTEPEKDLALKKAIDGAGVPVVLAAISPDTPMPADRRRYLDDFLRQQRSGYSNLAREIFGQHGPHPYSAQWRGRAQLRRRAGGGGGRHATGPAVPNILAPSRRRLIAISGLSLAAGAGFADGLAARQSRAGGQPGCRRGRAPHADLDLLPPDLWRRDSRPGAVSDARRTALGRAQSLACPRLGRFGGIARHGPGGCPAEAWSSSPA